MSEIMLRPDMRTAGGEVDDIVVDGRYVGTLTLVFRETDRITGSIQLEREALTLREKRSVIRFMQQHVQAMVQALQARECDILVTYSTYDHIIGTGDIFDEAWQDEAGKNVEEDFDYDHDWVEEDSRLVDFDPFDREDIELSEGGPTHAKTGTAGVKKPAEWEYRGSEYQSDDYSVVLARDDGDTLTYEIYRQSNGGLPIGTATVDISERQLTGFMDFREEGSTEDAEAIANLLMQELEKEKDYEGINLTVLYKNEPVDEMWFDIDQLH